MRRAFREHTHTVAVYIVHKWSTYMEERDTQRAGARVNRGQAVLYTGTQKEIWDTFVLFAYLLALFSQSCFWKWLISIYLISVVLCFISQYQHQPYITMPTDSLQTDAPKVSSYSTHTQQRQQQHTLVRKTRSPSPLRKLQFHLEEKSITSLFQGDAWQLWSGLWRSVFQIEDFSNWKRNIDIRFTVTIGITQCTKKSLINSMYFCFSNLF